MRRRRGFSLIELLIVIALIGLIATTVLPFFTDLKSRSAVRAARGMMLSSFAAARSAAIQKGKTASLSVQNSTLSVSALSGLRAQAVQIQGPVSVARVTGAVISPLNGAPTELVYDSRGLASPVRGSISRYEVRAGRRADTVCVTGAGAVIARGCVL